MAYPTEAEIAAVMQARNVNRISALQYIRRQGKKATVIAQPEGGVPVETIVKAAQSLFKPKRKARVKKATAPTKPKAARKAKRELPKSSSEQVKVDRAVLDDVIRKALRSAYGKPCPVLGVLGQRFAEPSKSQGYPFYRVLAETPDGLVAVFVSGFYDGAPTASISPAVKSSYTVKALLARLDRQAKRAAKKAAK